MTITTAQIFTDARTQNGFLDRPVSDEQLQQLYELFKFGPTAFNSTPARVAFVRSAEAKARLAECVMPGNVAKVLNAPVTAIIGMDLNFHTQLPRLFPAMDVSGLFASNEALAREAAFRNSSLQGAYLMIAARALGLDCGPMSGFDAGKVDAAFWSGTSIKTNFICALGYGDPTKVYPRSPRLSFEEACQLV
jgi:3-hydroxypropanoate dehydrogenase